VCQAKLIKKIKPDCPPGVQAGLNALAKTEEFTQILLKEIAARHLESKDVIQCISSIYREASKHTFGNDSVIAIYEQDHKMKERAVLAAFLKMQSGWLYNLEWIEGKSEG